MLNTAITARQAQRGPGTERRRLFAAPFVPALPLIHTPATAPHSRRAMASHVLHLIKLCVGADYRRRSGGLGRGAGPRQGEAAGAALAARHPDGPLARGRARQWRLAVLGRQGQIAARQKIAEIEPFVDADDRPLPALAASRQCRAPADAAVPGLALFHAPGRAARPRPGRAPKCRRRCGANSAS